MPNSRLAALCGLFYMLASPLSAAPVRTLVVQADGGKVLQRVGAQCAQ